MKKQVEPVHPGEVLKEEFMKPLGLSANKLARAIRVPPNRVSAIVNGERSVTADTALRLAKAFGTTPEFWLNLQRQHDLDRARDEATDLARIAPIRAAV
jgi:addiction module HigA family antidote